jgi:hypothetical protein
MALLFIGAMPPAARTSAYFTSALSSSSLVFQSGTVTLGAGLDLASLQMTVSGLYPDDTTGQYTAFAVANGGGASAVNMRYSVGIYTDTDTSGLAQQLKIALAAVSTCTNDTTTNSALDGGAALYRGPASGGALTGINLVGTRAVSSPASLTNEYVPELLGAPTDRALPVGDSQSLCMRVRLPSNAKTDVQGASATFSVRFVGVQDAGLVP